MTDPDIKSKRPLSPHLQVYRLPYNAMMSIIGRAVGIGLAISALALCGWFIAIVWSPDLYDASYALFDLPYIEYVFLLWAFATFFYMGNGIRHVLWDIGIGLNEKAGRLSGNVVLVVSVLLTLGLWQGLCGCWSVYFASNGTSIEKEAE